MIDDIGGQDRNRRESGREGLTKKDAMKVS